MHRILFLSLVILFVLAAPLHAQTDSQLRGGIVINEVLADPTGSSESFDTDGSGTAAPEDEFVELFNTGNSSIDIGGLEVWDEGSGEWFTIPNNTTLESESFAVVVGGLQSGGSLPAVGVGNEAFEAGQNSGVLNNGGDNIVLYDPAAEEYIQGTYNSDTQDDPTSYSGIPGTASRSGSVDAFGSIPDGVSKVRDPSGRTSYKAHNSVSSENASPGRSGGIALPVELTTFRVTTDAGRAILSWQTASETDNVGFAIEHRTGDTSHWNELGFVEGAGTTTQPQSYHFRTEPLERGTHSFRLRQTDVDGTTHLGPTQSVILSGKTGLSLGGPNPLSRGQRLSATVTVEVTQRVNVTLYNVLGQRVQTVVSGRVTPTQPIRTHVSTSALSSGVYFLRAEGPSIHRTQRLVVTR